jgi:hypothetical protein
MLRVGEVILTNTIIIEPKMGWGQFGDGYYVKFMNITY